MDVCCRWVGLGALVENVKVGEPARGDRVSGNAVLVEVTANAPLLAVGRAGTVSVDLNGLGVVRSGDVAGGFAAPVPGAGIVVSLLASAGSSEISSAASNV